MPLATLQRLASSCLAVSAEVELAEGLWGAISGKHFLVDFVAACPYDLLVKTAGGSVRYQAWVRIPKLLRLHRVVVWYQKKVCRR